MSLVQLTGLTLLPLIVLVAQGGLLQAVAHQRVGWGDGVHLPNLTPSPVNVSVNLTLSPFRVSPQFLSVTLDASALNQPWKYVINFTLPRVVTLAKGLAPAMLRLGGTSEDFILFSEGEDLSAEENGGPVLVKGPQLGAGMGPNRPNHTMSTSQWDDVNQFAQSVGWDFIFGLNLLLRHPWPTGNWDSANAEKLMSYTLNKGYTVNWELGNEPDLFSKWAPNIPVSPEQDAKDHTALKQLASEKSPNTRYVVGPDTAYMRYDYFGRFLESLGTGDIDAATWHTYYEDGDSAVLPDFFNATLLDKLTHEAMAAQGFVNKYRPDVELWLGETSSCSGGGAPVLSSSYVAGFMWLDKLGIAAVTNHSRVFRQSFVASHYGLLDHSLNPLPDYWLSLLYKRLVGTRVLIVADGLQLERHVRVYAHCANSLYAAGSVVLLIVNVNTYDSSVTLLDNELVASARDVYWLTPPGGTANITSVEVTLNGKLLQLDDGDRLPSLTPKEEAASDTLILPALSFGFYVFKNAKAAACS